MNKQAKKTFSGFNQTRSEVEDTSNDMTNFQDDAVNKSESTSEDDNMSDDANESEIDEKINWEEKYTTLNDVHLRLIAEFDNFRKRTIREKADLIKSGGAAVLTNLLPVVDDFERAISTLQATDDNSSAVNGVNIIYDKFIGYLSQQGVKMIDTIGQPFDTDLFEAIATFPAQDETQKGKVIDCVQTGYMLYDKVLRHAKVVVGE